MIGPRSGGLAKHPGIWKPLCAVLVPALLVIVFAHPLSAAPPSTEERADDLCRVSFSSSMFTEVNDNDVKAAVKAWAQVLFKERGVPMKPEITVLNGIGEISRALRSKLVDAIALTTDEYWSLQGEMRSSQVVVGLFDGRITEEYVLLAHRESGIDWIGDLKGRSIAFFMNQRMPLASPWIETLLLKEGLGRSSDFFGRVTHLNKLPKVVLPVFFRQGDACVVTRRGFQTMSELNPQVGQRLKIIASSPQLVPAGFFFREGFSKTVRDKALAELDRIHLTPTGLQALTVFQSGKLETHPISVLGSAFDLLENHKRLCAAADGLEGTNATPGPGDAAARMR